MIKITSVILLLFMSTCIFFLALESPVSATSAVMTDFSSVYGEDLANTFSCQICHLPALAGLNSYGEAFSTAGGGGCQDFSAPSNHTILESGASCAAYHRAGYKTPRDNTCIGCHGKDLKGESAPSCYICHDQVWQHTGLNPNPDFDVPSSHTKRESEDGYSAWHAPGLKHPFDNGCQNCHGTSLRGGIGPSCYACHGNEWDEEDDDSVSNGFVLVANVRSLNGAGSLDAFRSIENEDSDGDGYTNIEEIQATSNPGDAGSTPGQQASLTLKTANKWLPAWIHKNGYLHVAVVGDGVRGVDISQPAVLNLGKTRLLSSLTKQKGNTFYFLFRKAHLVQFLQQSDYQDVRVGFNCKLNDGSMFNDGINVKVTGKSVDVYLPNTARLQPEIVDVSTTNKVILRDPKLADLDTKKKLYIQGERRKVEIVDYTLTGSRLVVMISPVQLEKLYFDIGDGRQHTLAVTGYNKTSSTYLGATFAFKTTDSGGGDNGGGGGGGGNPAPEECKVYSPPGDHTIGYTASNCTYYHPSGASQPAENCADCHGSDLRGSSFAPSCYECHAQRW